MSTINNTVLAITGLVFSLLQACATAPKSPALDQARAAYSQADADTDTRKFATAELHDAKIALQKAESSQQANEQAHLAYLAKRQSELAITTGQRKRAEANLASLSEERDHLHIQISGDAQRRAMIRAKQLEAVMTEAKQTERGLVVTLGDAVFEPGKGELRVGAYRSIDKLASYLQVNPERRVAVEGHTDSRGNDDANMALSQHRAEAVAIAITARGIDRDRISVRGLGESSPIANNATAKGRQLNRRVDIIVLNPGKS